MNGHMDDGLLQDLAEGLLPPEEEERVRAHLEECPRCAERYETYAALVGGLRSLPREGEPSRDLWPQIAWRTSSRDGVPAAEAEESRTPEAGRRGARDSGGRTVTLPAWQLLAASLVVALVSGGMVWLLLTGDPEGPPPVAMEVPAEVRAVGWTEAYGGYDEAVADFEEILEKGRTVLDPETVRVLEENLATIEAAIGESREAVARDPASPLLRRILAENLRRKMDLLRHAAVAVYAAT